MRIVAVMIEAEVEWLLRVDFIEVRCVVNRIIRAALMVAQFARLLDEDRNFSATREQWQQLSTVISDAGLAWRQRAEISKAHEIFMRECSAVPTLVGLFASPRQSPTKVG